LLYFEIKFCQTEIGGKQRLNLGYDISLRRHRRALNGLVIANMAGQRSECHETSGHTKISMD